RPSSPCSVKPRPGRRRSSRGAPPKANRRGRSQEMLRLPPGRREHSGGNAKGRMPGGILPFVIFNGRTARRSLSLTFADAPGEVPGGHFALRSFGWSRREALALLGFLTARESRA